LLIWVRRSRLLLTRQLDVHEAQAGVERILTDTAG
jgi:hypothetical protein